jgi:hypothetical protein
MNNLEFPKEGIVNAGNVTFEEAKTALKIIAGPHVFVENEH